MTDSKSAPEHIRYCPKCAAPMTNRMVGDKVRRACPTCDYIHFTDPKVGVGVMVLAENKILLIKRAMRPNRGK
ncbi:MAG TPA: NUDIX hydrolase, partial [Anaerolineae bacterium]|nr:NUDIX hydrolase [Anaerolineae bacterium]